MALTNQKAWWGLGAVVPLSLTGVTGEGLVGFSGSQRVALPLADIVYAFSVEATIAADVARLDLATGQVTQQSGSPTITDEGIDLEGKALATAGAVLAMAVVADSGNTGNVAMVSDVDGMPEGALERGQIAQTIFTETPNGVTGGDNYDITLPEVGDKATVYVLAQA